MPKPGFITLQDKEWKIEKPGPYHFLLMSDWVTSDDTPEKFKTDNFAGFYLIYTCIVDDTGGELSDEISFREFLKSISFDELREVETSLSNFRDILESIKKMQSDKDN